MIGLAQREGGDASGLGPRAAACLPGAWVRYAVSTNSEQERGMAAAKAYDRLAAVIDAEWPDGVEEDTDDAIDALMHAIGDDAAIVTVLAGESILMLDQPAPNFMFISAKRLTALTVEEFRAWWSGDHARLLEDLAPAFAETYVQLNVDRAISERLCQRAGVPFRPFDGADSVYFDDAERLFGLVGTETAARLLAEDERRAVDVSAGGLCMIGRVVFDSQQARTQAFEHGG